MPMWSHNSGGSEKMTSENLINPSSEREIKFQSCVDNTCLENKIHLWGNLLITLWLSESWVHWSGKSTGLWFLIGNIKCI